MREVNKTIEYQGLRYKLIDANEIYASIGNKCHLCAFNTHCESESPVAGTAGCLWEYNSIWVEIKNNKENK